MHVLPTVCTGPPIVCTAQFQETTPSFPKDTPGSAGQGMGNPLVLNLLNLPYICNAFTFILITHIIMYTEFWLQSQLQ